jgi:4-oxalocrotonate tautomerase
MPMIQVTLVEGRSAERKHALIRELTEAAARTLEVPMDRVRVALHEVSPDNWGVGGVPYAVARGPLMPDSTEAD